ncbi:hypothetical protein M433DRAFT_437717 [Acidomyces richmondensis BFW]|nr:hypothetical protein M433DRAFT_437717 [Acidomyces richmondensis BFW]
MLQRYDSFYQSRVKLSPNYLCGVILDGLPLATAGSVLFLADRDGMCHNALTQFSSNM